ncbi:MAG TPA: restriction endonuclease subunit S, partial [Bryobacteraceae bacterium]
WVREARDHLSQDGLAVSRGFPPNTILVTCIGATIGKTGLVRVAGACNQQINFVVPDGMAQSSFVFFQMVSPRYQEQIKDNASSTTLPILNKGKFCNLPFAICGRAEQDAIVNILEERLSRVEALEVEIDRAVTKANALRQSILKKAFSGKLVAQDPSDEPSAIMLARLHEEMPTHRSGRRKAA